MRSHLGRGPRDGRLTTIGARLPQWEGVSQWPDALALPLANNAQLVAGRWGLAATPGGQ